MSEQIHCWTFKVLYQRVFMCFGISAAIHGKEQIYYYNAIHMNNKESHKERNSKYKFYLRNGTVIKMQLNLKDKTLIFYTDSECCGTAYNEIETGEDIYYKMTVCFRDIGSSVELLDYTVS